MPFFLAVDRKATFSGRVQAAPNANTEYQRSPPSAVLIQLASAYLYPIKTIAFSVMGAIAAMVNKDIIDPTKDQEYIDTNYYSKPFTLANSMPLLLPDVNIQLFGSPSQKDLDIMESSGGENQVKTVGQAVTTWTLKPKTLEDLANITNLDKTRPGVATVVNAINVEQAPSLIHFITIIPFISSLLYTCSHLSDVEMDFTMYTVKKENPEAEQTEEGNVETEESMEVEEDDPRAGFQTATIVNHVEHLIKSIKFRGLHSLVGKKYFGPVDTCPVDKGGIFFPFDPSLSLFDISIAAHHLEAFKGLYFSNFEEYENESVELLQHWSASIHRSTTGQYLAHMMRIQILAKESGSWPYFIVTNDGQYQGGVIMGEDIRIRRVGRSWVEASSPEQLVEDLEACNRHTVAMRKVLVAAGATASVPDQFKTLRQLQEMVMSAGMPSGVVMNLIRKEFKNLSFNEKPAGVNVETITETLEYLTSDKRIPNTWFLDTEFFFSENRYELVLARFGSAAPNFNYGGDTKIRCCSLTTKLSDKLSWDRNTPPTILETAKTKVAVAASQWKQLLEGGVMNIISNRSLNNGRKWSGQEKLLLWHAFDDNIRKTIKQTSVQAGSSSGQQGGGGGGKRVAVDDVDNEKVARAKKMSRFK